MSGALPAPALPEPALGLVVRYEYLWLRRAADADTADKERPACIVATFRKAGGPEDFVLYLPISHTPPGEGEAGIELPDAVKAKAGLDGARQWVLVSECNLDIWPYDLRRIPGREGAFHDGYLPAGMFRVIRDAFVARYRAGRIRPVNRGA